MEKLLQNIVKKFIKQIDFNKIQLKKVEDGHADEIDSSQADGNDYHVYKIKYNHLTIGTVVTITNRIENTKYLANIDINAAFRSRGIGGYVLRHWFSGYYIMADNSRAARLYARLGKIYNKFTHKEFEEFVKLAGMRGVYKLDHKGAIMRHRAIARRGHKDFGVKGMKKGQHLKAQDPEQNNSKGPSKPAPNPVAMQRLKNAGVAVGQKRGLLTRLKEGYKANRAIGKEISSAGGIGNKLKAGILFNPIASANRAAGTALMIRKFEKAHGLGDSSNFRDSLVLMKYRRRKLMDAKRSYIRAKKNIYLKADSVVSLTKHRDFKYNFKNAKRRYQDALRRYQDSVLDTLKQKFNDLTSKIKNKIKEYIKMFPSLSKILSIVLTIDSIGNTYGVVAGAPKVMMNIDKFFKEIDKTDLSSYGKAGAKVRGVLSVLFIALKQITKAIIKFKAAVTINKVLAEK